MNMMKLIPTDLSQQAMWNQVKHGPVVESDYEMLKDCMPSYTYLLIVKLLRCTGLRLSEILTLTSAQKQHVGLSHCVLIQRAKKRGNEAAQLDPVFMPAELGIELDSYIKDHLRRPGDPVFQRAGGKQGKRISNRALEYVFRQASEQIGRRITPHMLRSYFSNHLMNNGVPPETVSQLLGHNNVKTTLQHYRQLTMDKRRQIGEQIRP
jgi:integrase